MLAGWLCAFPTAGHRLADANNKRLKNVALLYKYFRGGNVSPQDSSSCIAPLRSLEWVGGKGKWAVRAHLWPPGSQRRQTNLSCRSLRCGWSFHLLTTTPVWQLTGVYRPQSVTHHSSLVRSSLEAGPASSTPSCWSLSCFLSHRLCWEDAQFHSEGPRGAK